MEITKKPKIKSIPYEEFIDNESLEKLVRELNAGGANVALGVLDDFINWGRSNFCSLYERGEIARERAITTPTKASAVSKTTTKNVKFIIQ